MIRKALVLSPLAVLGAFSIIGIIAAAAIQTLGPAGAAPLKTLRRQPSHRHPRQIGGRAQDLTDQRVIEGVRIVNPFVASFDLSTL